jgi:hypothetical protein
MYIKRHRSICTLCDAIGILVCTNTQYIFNNCNAHNVVKHFICIYIGTKEERGLLAWGQSSEDSKDKPLSSDYEEGYEIYEIKSYQFLVSE